MQSQKATQPTINAFSVALKSCLTCRFVHFFEISRTIHIDQSTGKTSEDKLLSIMLQMLAP
jgi:hypothetical protein